MAHPNSACRAVLRCACRARHRLLSSPPLLATLSQRKLRTPCTRPCNAPVSNKQLTRIPNHPTILQVMSVVKSLASHGITICATIHSPTPYTFNLFDRLLLLLKGRVVYFGPNGERLVALADLYAVGQLVACWYDSFACRVVVLLCVGSPAMSPHMFRRPAPRRYKACSGACMPRRPPCLALLYMLFWHPPGLCLVSLPSPPQESWRSTTSTPSAPAWRGSRRGRTRQSGWWT